MCCAHYVDGIVDAIVGADVGVVGVVVGVIADVVIAGVVMHDVVDVFDFAAAYILAVDNPFQTDCL